MSEVVYHRCDMCGDLVADETKMATSTARVGAILKVISSCARSAA